ncbi:MAG: iron dicitrate transport regulator FecR, partial [Rhodopirellula sp. JB044]|uniref:iron dicitrate transport regulator FecR n=1 Tax=Rhodopirellula sp. JB044 TaxID=3342844 RepID=UPI00370C84CF
MAPALQRLRTDRSLRQSLAEELAMLSQTRAVQASEPRWLKLEDALGAALEHGDDDAVFESRVMAGLSQIAPRYRSRRKWFAVAALVSTAAAIVAFALLPGWLAKQGIEGENAFARQQAPPPIEIVPENQGGTNAQPRRPLGGVKLVSHSRTSAVAVLSQAVNAQWSGKYRPVAGEGLGLGDLVLRRGAVQIEFLSGVRLLLQAPANIELRAADEVLIRYGAASCFVTDMGHGFRVLTKSMEVVDRGTAFSIDVKLGGNPEVHVTEGSVEIKTPQHETHKVHEMHAIRMGESGPEDIEYSPDRFLKTSVIRGRQNAIARRRYNAWKEYAHTLSADPSVLLHYTFEENDPSALELTNVATDPSRATDGVIIGCQWDRGRWRSKRALLYRNASDRVLFQVPGAFDKATFLVWARVDAITQGTTSLLMTEHPGRRALFSPADDQSISEAMERRSKTTVETVRWELAHHTNNVLFSVGHGIKESDYDKLAVDHPYTRSDRWGTWACMGVTCDAKTRTVTHYLNGQPIGTGQFKRAEPLLLDFMELGNFGTTVEELEETGGSAQRRFFGAIDELVIADRVFDESEIKAF